MDKATAQRIVRYTFKAGFDRKRYRDFINELCNGFDESTAQNMGVPAAFAPHIKSCQRLGTFESPEGELADVLIVQLTESYKLERTRTALRDFVAYALKRGEGSENAYKEAGLVAFVAPDSESWRFSYVRMEYETKRNPKTGKIRAEERLTPARRYSYLVGADEECHTAQSRFLVLLQNTSDSPTLAQIEEAFSVESVTKEFFREYARLFEDTDAALAAIVKRDKAVRDEFKAKGVSTVDFSKKLLGQIVFLYFVQKKGWLGVAKGGKWGEGPRNFMRVLSDQAIQEKKHLFTDILEPLFYDTLATDRGPEAWCKTFNCRIPFLNGGLFEPLAGYEWEKANIDLPNSLFTNKRLSLAGDVGTGILDVFDRYNFTVNEAEPLEKEVAIDPEMLGKVFENLIEENRRKGLGAYYTPREIVHYMCQESLINYLDTGLNRPAKLLGAAAPLPENQPPLFVNSDEKPKTKLGQLEFTEPGIRSMVPREELVGWIQQSDQFAHYAAAIAAGTKGEHYPKPPDSIRKYAQEIDALLRDITVCDPAIGSGAFPVGMMSEIIRARAALTPYFKDLADRTAYHFKRHAIQNSLYGVDIDIGAVEIAKLRLWLSLVVDEEDVQEIKPLPNLDYKIVVGNSLLGVQKNLFNQDKFNRLEELKPKFFNESDRKKKAQFKRQIEALIHELTNGRKAFDFEIYFSEVFHAKNGFDVMIANPPYVGEKGNKDTFREIKDGPLGSFYLGKMDLFYYFFHLALNLGGRDSSIAFITTNYYPTAGGARKLRFDFRKRSTVRHLINFGELKLFESALGQHNMITLLSKPYDASINATNCFSKRRGMATPEALRSILSGADEETEYYNVPQHDLYEGAESYIRLRGVRGVEGDVTHAILNKLSASNSVLGHLCNVNIGMRTGADKVSENYIETYKLDLEKGQGIFVLSDHERKRLHLNKIESSMLLPFFKNSDIKRYWSKTRNDLWLIDLTYPKYKNVDWKSIPNLHRHIKTFEKILKGRRSNDNGLQAVIKAGYWWCYTMRQLDFSQEKVISPQRSYTNTFAYNSVPWVASMDVYFITQRDSEVSLKFIISLLNSKLYYFWLYHKGKRKGEMLELYQTPLSEIPVRRISAAQQRPFIRLVDNILSAKLRNPTANISAVESEIDELVFDLYQLTAAERSFVKSAAESSVE